jgi:hypothetical protein
MVPSIPFHPIVVDRSQLDRSVSAHRSIAGHCTALNTATQF